MILWLISLAVAKDVTKCLEYTTMGLVIRASICLHLVFYRTE